MEMIMFFIGLIEGAIIAISFQYGRARK